MVALELIASVPDVVVRIVAIVLIAVAVRWLVGVALRRVVQAAIRRHDTAPERAGRMARAGHDLIRDTGWSTERYVQRTRTVASLLGSIATLVVVLVAVLMVMDLLGLPLTPILASAGIGGVAVGFGAQSLVKDFIGGVFMILEDQYGVGDRVSIGTVTGVIEEVTLRVTTVRDDQHVIWYLRNGDISQVGNRSQGPEIEAADGTDNKGCAPHDAAHEGPAPGGQSSR